MWEVPPLWTSRKGKLQECEALNLGSEGLRDAAEWSSYKSSAQNQSLEATVTENEKFSQAILEARNPWASPSDLAALLSKSIPSSTFPDPLKDVDLCLGIFNDSIFNSVLGASINFLSSLSHLTDSQPTPLIPLAKQIDINIAANIPPLPSPPLSLFVTVGFSSPPP